MQQSWQTLASCPGSEAKPEYCVLYGSVYVADNTGETSSFLVTLGWEWERGLITKSRGETLGVEYVKTAWI